MISTALHDDEVLLKTAYNLLFSRLALSFKQNCKTSRSNAQGNDVPFHRFNAFNRVHSVALNSQFETRSPHSLTTVDYCDVFCCKMIFLCTK